MSPADLLTELESKGITVEPRPNGNLYLAPKARLTPELVERVRAKKHDLLTYLRARQVARWCETNGIEPVVAAEIMRVEDEALRLGWSRERLWNPEFWPHLVGHPRGLPAVLQPRDTIAEVTADQITIIADRRHRLRFGKDDC